MASFEINARLLRDLAGKIDGLNLTREETAVLNAILVRATDAEAEVEGFCVKNGQPMGFVFESGAGFTGAGDGAAKFAQALGFALPDLRLSIDPEHDTPLR